MRTGRLLAAGIVGLAIIAAPRVGWAQGLVVSGYADFEAVLNNVDADDSDFYFDNHHFNLIMVGDIVDDLYAAVEVEYEHSGEEIAFEYGYFGYTGIPDVRIMAGKFIVPFGRFNKDLHPTIINKMPDRPHGFKDILPQTWNDAGLWVSGVRDFGTGARFVFDGFAINGLMGSDGGGIRGMRDNDREKRTGARDDNKAVGARVGLELGPQGLDFGASVYRGQYSDDAAVTGLNLTLFGVDAAFRRSGLELRGELVSASQDATGGDLTKTGWYAQAAYRIQQFEPVVRYSSRRFSGGAAGALDGDDANDDNRFSVGLNFHIGAASILRAVYHLNSEATGFESDNN
ncbi:MAG: hypothetical protein ACE5FJ_03670, partial [Gemmatimonadales bacterium]